MGRYAIASRHTALICHPGQRLFADQFQFTLNVSVREWCQTPKQLFYSSLVWHVENISCVILDQKVQRFAQGGTNVAGI